MASARGAVGVRGFAGVTLAALVAIACGSESGAGDGDGGAGSEGGAGPGGATKVECTAPGSLPFLSAKRIAGGTPTVEVEAITLSADGTTFAAGDFAGVLAFGAGLPPETKLESAQETRDVWVAKLAPDATVLWAKRAGGTLDDSATALEIGADGALVVGGRFGGTALFGAGEPKEVKLATKGEQDAFVAKYGVDGAIQWVKRIGGRSGTGVAKVTQVLVAPDGSVRVLGTLEGTVVFGEGEARETTIASTASSQLSDQFLARLRADGSLEWVKHVANVTFRGALTRDGSVHAVGFSSATSTVFAVGEPEQTQPFGTGSFHARWGADGKFKAATRFSKSATSSANGGRELLASGSDGSTTIAGTFADALTLGEGEANETTVRAPNNARDGYVARFRGDDTLQWVRTVTGGAGVDVLAIQTASDGTLRVAGSFSNTVTLAPGELDSVKLRGATGSGFLANFGADGSLRSAKVAVTGRRVALLPSDGSLRVVGTYGNKPFTVGEGETGSVALEAPTFRNLFVASYGACP